MKAFPSILVVVPFRSSEPALRSLVANSMSMGKWLDSEIHFLADHGESRRIQSQIDEFHHAHRSAPATVILSSVSGNAADRVLETIQEPAYSLVILQDGIVLHPEMGIDGRRLLELSGGPVLLLPRQFNFTKSPAQRFLVPLSGEGRVSEALAVSLRLADQTASAVDFLHVMSPVKPCDCGQTLEVLGDQLHHEYGHMVDKIAAEASPFSTARERSHIHHFFHRSGFASAEIASQLGDSPGAILVLEWKGTFASGHAATVKELLLSMKSPILFVRAMLERKSTLRVGKYLRAA